MSSLVIVVGMSLSERMRLVLHTHRGQVIEKVHVCAMCARQVTSTPAQCSAFLRSTYCDICAQNIAEHALHR